MSDDLITPRVRLRRARMEDLSAIHAVLSDPVGMRYWSTPPHERLAQSHDWLSAMVQADTTTSDDYIVEKDGLAIGKLGCFKLPDIGFNIARACWGQGLASEAMAAFLAHRRAVAPGGRLTADVDPRNAASLALLNRHGFVETGRASGTWQLGDELCDSVYLALDL